ncbi:hypothetical protein Baya_7795 [Bagarius yarrelli]|uniref:Uncharacterized protein n=1 Tax=Bagarius yarrelli TaxID=175774 RepID=A0A556U2J3_BAGYA|nr:hypothetical protein Baya_7795 [Bagarius yarrelli]
MHSNHSAEHKGYSKAVDTRSVLSNYIRCQSIYSRKLLSSSPVRDLIMYIGAGQNGIVSLLILNYSFYTQNNTKYTKNDSLPIPNLAKAARERWINRVGMCVGVIERQMQTEMFACVQDEDNEREKKVRCCGYFCLLSPTLQQLSCRLLHTSGPCSLESDLCTQLQPPHVILDTAACPAELNKRKSEKDETDQRASQTPAAPISNTSLILPVTME